MNDIIIASTATSDRLDKVYILLNSIKQTKQPETKITYYLFVSRGSMDYCCTYFKPLVSTDFYIVISNLDTFAPYVHTPARDHIYYAKCLFPSYFQQYSKLLYLDVDMAFVNRGIEDLWNEDISDSYIGACIDPTWNHCSNYSFDKINCKTTTYFNAGMILFNCDKIRAEGKAEKLKDWCLNWNLRELACNCFDQTLLNYILREKVTILDFKYNNSFLSSLVIAKDAYTYYLNALGYEKPEDSLHDAVILHFCGANKPWIGSNNDSNYPYKHLSQVIWNEICEKYEKKEQT